jgi:hypothetical protein
MKLAAAACCSAASGILTPETTATSMQQGADRVLFMESCAEEMDGERHMMLMAEAESLAREEALPCERLASRNGSGGASTRVLDLLRSQLAGTHTVGCPGRDLGQAIVISHLPPITTHSSAAHVKALGVHLDDRSQPRSFLAHPAAPCQAHPFTNPVNVFSI